MGESISRDFCDAVIPVKRLPQPNTHHHKIDIPDWCPLEDYDTTSKGYIENVSTTPA